MMLRQLQEKMAVRPKDRLFLQERQKAPMVMGAPAVSIDPSQQDSREISPVRLCHFFFSTGLMRRGRPGVAQG